jgi:D-alanyl-D-alanine endopeptidase (penicillin-binding protein 7)
MTVSSLMPAATVDIIGWALVRFVWEGLLVGAVSAGVLRALRAHGARQRYAVCCAALGVCLAIPLLQVATALREPERHVDPGIGAAGLPWSVALAAALPLVVTAWSLGAALMAARLVAGFAWVGRLRARAGSVPAHWQITLDALAARVGAPVGVLVQGVERLASPVTVGWWRPVVLVPAALFTQMPAPLLEALLAHELAHIARRDYLVNLLQSVIETLLFFHPVVWWLSARLRAERELVADELAGRAIDDPRRLATALHALTATPPTPAHAAWALPARGGSLLRRIEALVSPRPSAASWKPALVVTLLAATSLCAQWPSLAAGSEAAAARRAAATMTAPTSIVALRDTAHLLAGAAPPLPDGVGARHVLVLDEATGRVLMARDADALVPIASLTKLMTAMVVLDAHLAPAERLRIEPADVDPGLHGRSQLAVGAHMTRGTALVMALLTSDNGAAAALSRTYPGGPLAFVQALQAKIRSLGLQRTTLAEPTGLSSGNASTATEMARIVAASARYPEIASITGERAAEVLVDGRPRQLRNHNPLVGAAGWDIRLSKTGFTRAAGDCLTMRLRAAGKDVTLVLLDAPDEGHRLRDVLAIQHALAHPPAA